MVIYENILLYSNNIIRQQNNFGKKAFSTKKKQKKFLTSFWMTGVILIVFINSLENMLFNYNILIDIALTKYFLKSVF